MIANHIMGFMMNTTWGGKRATLTLAGVSFEVSAGGFASSDELGFLLGGGRGKPFCAGVGGAPYELVLNAAAAAATRPTELLISSVAACDPAPTPAHQPRHAYP